MNGKKCLKVFLSLILAACLSTAAVSSTATVYAGEDALTLEETKEALKSAYIYTLPLQMINATREKALLMAPSNALFHTRKLSDDKMRAVVTPNVDTLYSQVFLDFSRQEAMVLEKPAADRYYMIQVMNAYTDTLEILGTGADGQAANKYLFTSKDYRGEVPKGMVHVRAETDLVWVLIRIECADAADYPAIYELQAKTSLMPLANYLSGEPYVPEPEPTDHDLSFIPIQYVMGLSLKEYFDSANQLMSANPPKPRDRAMMKILAGVNVGPGMTFDDTILGEDPTLLWRQIRNEANLEAAAETMAFNSPNGAWSYFDRPIGDYGKEYSYRAMVSLRGLAANPIRAAVYARTHADEAGAQLNGAHQYRIHFEKDALPPVRDYGFWSVTAYGPDDFLIPNDADKFAITDRAPFVMNADGSLDLYLAQTVPEGIDPANWLPVGDEDFHLFLRIYLPSQDVAKGKWTTPTIVRMD